MSVPRSLPTGCYWARFEAQGGHLLRFDTRIYLRPRSRPARADRLLGCIIGKNPGSAVPLSLECGLQPIALQGDRFLPTVRAIVAKAHARANRPCPERAYVQVLNLFYLCDRDLRRARSALRTLDERAVCATERRRFPWTWYAWGGPDALLDPLKARFLSRRPRLAFYHCGGDGLVKEGRPAPGGRARHTQGMPHDAVVEHLAALLRSECRSERGQLSTIAG